MNIVTYRTLAIIAGEQVPIDVNADDEDFSPIQVASAAREVLLNAEIRVGDETFTPEDVEDFWS